MPCIDYFRNPSSGHFLICSGEFSLPRIVGFYRSSFFPPQHSRLQLAQAPRKASGLCIDYSHNLAVLPYTDHCPMFDSRTLGHTFIHRYHRCLVLGPVQEKQKNTDKARYDEIFSDTLQELHHRGKNKRLWQIFIHPLSGNIFDSHRNVHVVCTDDRNVCCV